MAREQDSRKPHMHAAMDNVTKAANFIEKPFFYESVTGPLDDRPLGSASWLPIMAVAYFASLTMLKPLAGAKWLQKPVKLLVSHCI